MLVVLLVQLVALVGHFLSVKLSIFISILWIVALAVW